MGAKVSTVVLVSTDGKKQEFEVSHAERILALQNTQWVLPSDSPYEYDNNGIKPRRGKKGNSAEE